MLALRKPWWRHKMETISALLAICAGNSPVPGEFPAQRPVTRSFDVFFDLRLNKRLSKQSWDWWFETISRSLWRHCNAINKWDLVRLQFRGLRLLWYCWKSRKSRILYYISLLLLIGRCQARLKFEKGYFRTQFMDCYFKPLCAVECHWTTFVIAQLLFR